MKFLARVLGVIGTLDNLLYITLGNDAALNLRTILNSILDPRTTTSPVVKTAGKVTVRMFRASH